MQGRRRKPVRRLRKGRFFLVLGVFLAVLLGSSYYVLAKTGLLPWQLDNPPAPSAGDEANQVQGRVNVLLLGIDARPGEVKSRSDSMILASYDQSQGRMVLISIPRDTLAAIPGHGMDKINAANFYGGPELAKKTVSRLLDVPVDYYVLTNFSGFKDIVDTLGGVTIDVKENMYHYDPNPMLRINLHKGVQHLDGEKALQYVRFRDDPLGDISRTERQQTFLKAVASELLQPMTILKLPQLVPEIEKNIKTDMSLKDMIAFARALHDLDGEQVVSQTLPGVFLNKNGISYWSVDKAKTRELVAELFDGGAADQRVVQGEINENTPPVVGAGGPVSNNPAPVSPDSVATAPGSGPTGKTTGDNNIVGSGGGAGGATPGGQAGSGSGTTVEITPGAGTGGGTTNPSSPGGTSGNAGNSGGGQQTGSSGGTTAGGAPTPGSLPGGAGQGSPNPSGNITAGSGTT